jgi:hypothetical protein
MRLSLSIRPDRARCVMMTAQLTPPMAAEAAAVTAPPVTVAPPPRAPSASLRPPARELVLRAVAFGAGRHLYLPFDVPPGIGRVEARLVSTTPAVRLGIGLFDQRGPGWQSPGFRGVYGHERAACFVAAGSASPGFLPGPVEPGRWTVVVPVFVAPVPARLRVHVRLLPEGETTPAAAAAVAPERAPGAVLDEPGWYKGDLHCHTVHSSDALASGSALDPAGWAATCRRQGLDFAALTDHNTVAQNADLAAAAGDGVLLLAGEEMTTCIHGHATVIGLPPGAWVDWRQAPLGLPLPKHGARIVESIRLVRELGAYLAAAHPFISPTRPWNVLSWHFLADALADPSARPDGFEVWNGPWRHSSEATLRLWEWLLRRGWRIVVNGGSDLHGVDNAHGLAAGHPTTVVHAEALAAEPVVAALRAGRSYVTASPDGPELLLAAETGDEATGIGGDLHGRPGRLVSIRARTRDATGLRLEIRSAGRPVLTAVVGEADQSFTVTMPLPHHRSYVRAELRAAPGRLAPRGPMRALTNPIWLVPGAAARTVHGAPAF